MISVRELITDRSFAQEFILIRQTGQFINGRWVNDPIKRIRMKGVIHPLSAKELMKVPEADRITGSIKIYSREPLYITTTSGNRISDKVLWKDQEWKIISINNWSDHKHYSAIATRISGH